MNLLELIEELNEAHIKFEKYFPKYIQYKIEYEQLEASKKFVYSNNLPEDGPEWKAKKVAETSEEYETLCYGISNAKEKFMKGYATIEPIKMRIESLRTMISALKTEVRNFGG